MRGLLILFLALLQTTLLCQDASKLQSDTLNRMINNFTDANLKRVQVFSFISKAMADNDALLAEKLMRYCFVNGFLDTAALEFRQEKLYRFVMNDFQNVLLTDSLSLIQKYRHNTKYDCELNIVSGNSASFLKGREADVYTKIDSSKLSLENKDYLKLLLADILYRYGTVAERDKLDSIRKIFLGKYPEAIEKTPELFKPAYKDVDWAFTGFIGVCAPFFTGDLNDLFSTTAGFEFGLEGGYKGFRWQMNGAYIYPKVKKQFNYNGVWNKDLPLDGIYGELSIGYNIIEKHSFNLRPMFVYSGLHLETDDRLKSYTKEEHDMDIEFMGFQIVASNTSTGGHEGGLLFWRARFGLSWPISHCSSPQYKNAIISTALEIGIGID